MIEVSGLRKLYPTRRRRKVTSVEALGGVDFAVQRGNGAGKATTLRMLATLIRPRPRQAAGAPDRVRSVHLVRLRRAQREPGAGRPEHYEVGPI